MGLGGFSADYHGPLFTGGTLSLWLSVPALAPLRNSLQSNPGSFLDTDKQR
jgi:hypothetical protein